MYNEKNEKEYTEGIRIQKDEEGGKWENFWYHYKWPVIGFLVLAIILGVCFAQSCSQEQEDIILLYAGPAEISLEKAEQLSQVMNAAMPYDLDGDGKKNAAINSYLIYSEEQIKAIESELDEDGNPQQVNRSFISSEYQSYTTRLQQGECSVLFLDPVLFESLRDNGNQPLQRLDDVLTCLPKGATEDGFGVRLGDTDLYARYEVLRALPPDTIVCLSRPYVLGANANEKRYEREIDMFAAIVGGERRD